MEDNSDYRVGGWLSAAGAAGIAAVAALYASVPFEASVPLPAGASLAQALATTLAHGGTLCWAGTIGLIADIVLIGGSVLLAGRASRQVGHRLFWGALALSMGIFLVVDGLVGQVIPAVAAATTSDLSSYALARAAFDAAFALGVLTFGLGLLAGAAGAGWPPVFRYVGFVIGALAAVSALLHFMGITIPVVMGGSIALTALFTLLLAIGEARASA